MIFILPAPLSAVRTAESFPATAVFLRADRWLLAPHCAAAAVFPSLPQAAGSAVLLLFFAVLLFTQSVDLYAKFLVRSNQTISFLVQRYHFVDSFFLT